MLKFLFTWHLWYLLSSYFIALSEIAVWKLIFLFLNQNICCGYSKEPSRWDGSFEHPKQVFKVMDKKMFAILFSQYMFTWARNYNASLALRKT